MAAEHVCFLGAQELFSRPLTKRHPRLRPEDSETGRRSNTEKKNGTNEADEGWATGGSVLKTRKIFCSRQVGATTEPIKMCLKRTLELRGGNLCRLSLVFTAQLFSPLFGLASFSFSGFIVLALTVLREGCSICWRIPCLRRGRAPEVSCDPLL